MNKNELTPAFDFVRWLEGYLGIDDLTVEQADDFTARQGWGEEQRSMLRSLIQERHRQGDGTVKKRRVWVWDSVDMKFKQIEAERFGPTGASAGIDHYLFWGDTKEEARRSVQQGLAKRINRLQKEVDELSDVYAKARDA